MATKKKKENPYRDLAVYIIEDIKKKAKDQKGAWDHWVEDLEKRLEAIEEG